MTDERGCYTGGYGLAATCFEADDGTDMARIQFVFIFY
jgi:hypothetical protein